MGPIQSFFREVGVQLLRLVTVLAGVSFAGLTGSAALAAGIYGIDARLTLSGAVEMTEQSGFIALSQAAVA